MSWPLPITPSAFLPTQGSYRIDMENKPDPRDAEIRKLRECLKTCLPVIELALEEARLRYLRTVTAANMNQTNEAVSEYRRLVTVMESLIGEKNTKSK